MVGSTTVAFNCARLPEASGDEWVAHDDRLDQLVRMNLLANGLETCRGVPRPMSPPTLTERKEHDEADELLAAREQHPRKADGTVCARNGSEAKPMSAWLR